MQTWPVCHVTDNARLHAAILTKILDSSADLGHGRQGYYLASSGSVAWDDVYAAMTKALQQRGVVSSAAVTLADDEALGKMVRGLGGGPKELVRVQAGGK